jgi:protein TonB
MNLGMGNEELEISSLVAPIIPADVQPEPPKTVEQQKNSTEKIVNETIRQTNTLRIEENPIVPNQISVTPNTQKPRPVGAFIIKDATEETGNVLRNSVSREGNENGSSLGENNSAKTSENIEKEEIPEIKKPVVVKENKLPTIVTKGVINGQATSLPKPVYSEAAKAVRAAGDVSVQVTIDERGNVISAKAVSGHILLRADSERAARSAKFTPTLLSQQPVKVTGIIIYKFALQ